MNFQTGSFARKEDLFVKKIFKFCCCLLLIIPYYFLHFAIAPFSGGVVNGTLFVDTGVGLQYSATALLLFTIQTLLISFLLYKYLLPEEKLFENYTFHIFAKSFFPLFGIRVLLDVVFLFVNWLFLPYGELVRVLFDGAFLVISFYIMERMYLKKRPPQSSLKIILSISLLAVSLIGFVGYVIMFEGKWRYLRRLSEKYVTVNSPDILTKTAETEMYLFSLIWLFMVFIFSLIIFGFLNRYKEEKKYFFWDVLKKIAAVIILFPSAFGILWALIYYCFPAGMADSPIQIGRAHV